VSTAEFDIAGERAYKDQAKIRVRRPAAGGGKEAEKEDEQEYRKRKFYFHDGSLAKRLGKNF